MRSIVFIALCISSLSYAGEVFTVKTMAFVGKNGAGIEIAGTDVTTPFIESTKGIVASKINNLLFIELYGALAPVRYAKLFGENDAVELSGLSNQSFTVVLNNGRVFSLAFSGEGCGAYCEDFTRYYAFDASTGNHLVPSDLFTASASIALTKKMLGYKQMLYTRQIALLEAELKQISAAKAKAEDIEVLEGKIALNKGCLSDLAEQDARTNPFTRYGYNFNRTGVEINSERCSNHALRAYDDVGNVVLTIPYSELRPYLSDYGKYLFLNEGKVASDNSIYGKILTGRIGEKSMITMLLHKYDNGSIHGVYFYNKYRQAIKLSGSESANELMLDESAAETTTAKMRLKRGTEKLTGSWIGNKTLIMELTK